MFSPSPFGWISQYFIGYFFAYGVYIPFWALWFKDQGISASDIGILMGVAFTTRFVANLVITPRLHKVEYLIPAIRWLSFLSVIFIAFHFFTGGDFWMMAGATILFNLCCGPTIPLSDSITNYYARLGKLDYGRTRLWGSIAFIGGSTAVGYLVAAFGIDMIVYTVLAGTAVALLLSMRNPTLMPKSDIDRDTVRPNLFALVKRPDVFRFLILVSLIQGSHAAYYSFSTIYWKSIGHSETIIGYLWSIGVISEVTIFATSKRLFRKMSLQTMFMIASAGVLIRWCLTATMTDITALVLIQLLHGVTFATAHLAAIQYIQKANQNEMVPLQALYNAIPLGVFTALMMVISGISFELWGANVFWGMAVMGIFALLIKIEQKKPPLKPQIEF